jgi:ApaG protein
MAKYQFSVRVVPRYLSEQSEPGEQRYVFAYTVTIANTGDTRAQLLTRHWIITDGNGQVNEVRGQGVVGEQPVLAPGEAFEYTSGCPLETPVGTMRGSYLCVADDGTRFQAEVPEFALAGPRTLH